MRASSYGNKTKSDGKVNIKTRLKRSPDLADALANTFYPNAREFVNNDDILKDIL